MYNEGMNAKQSQVMTVAEAYRVHRNAARNVGRGRGYTARRLDEALPVLHEFWAAMGTATYITKEMVDNYDARGGDNDGEGQ